MVGESFIGDIAELQNINAGGKTFGSGTSTLTTRIVPCPPKTARKLLHTEPPANRPKPDVSGAKGRLGVISRFEPNRVEESASVWQGTRVTAAVPRSVAGQRPSTSRAHTNDRSGAEMRSEETGRQTGANRLFIGKSGDKNTPLLTPGLCSNSHRPSSTTSRGSLTSRIGQIREARSEMAKRIEFFEDDKAKGRTRPFAKSQICEADFAQSYAQLRGGGGSTLSNLNGDLNSECVICQQP